MAMAVDGDYASKAQAIQIAQQEIKQWADDCRSNPKMAGCGSGGGFTGAIADLYGPSGLKAVVDDCFGNFRVGRCAMAGAMVAPVGKGVRGGKLAIKLAKGGKAAKGLPRDLKGLAEANLTDSGETVLGHFRNGYIDKARARGASYFDIGDVWNTLSKAQQTAANDHFLDIIAARGDLVVLATVKKEIRPGSPLAHEIQYLIGEKGYRWVNQWSLRPR